MVRSTAPERQTSAQITASLLEWSPSSPVRCAPSISIALVGGRNFVKGTYSFRLHHGKHLSFFEKKNHLS